MKRFVFRLESVLRIRVFELERARIALATIEAEESKRVAALRRASEQLATGRALLESEMAKGVDGNRLAMRASGLAVGRLQLAKAESSLAELAKPLAEARRLVRERGVRVRSLERLREHAAEKARQKGLAAEQSEIEELAITRLALARSRAVRGRGERTR